MVFCASTTLVPDILVHLMAASGVSTGMDDQQRTMHSLLSGCGDLTELE